MQWQCVSIGAGEGLGVPLGHRQRFTGYLAGGNPVQQTVGAQRILLQLSRAGIAGSELKPLLPQVLVVMIGTFTPSCRRC